MSPKSEKDETVDEVFRVLFNADIPEQKVCKSVPQQVKENYVFLVAQVLFGLQRTYWQITAGPGKMMEFITSTLKEQKILRTHQTLVATMM